MISLLVPITSRNCPKEIERQPLLTSLLPSLKALDVPFNILLGYDSDDSLWSNSKARSFVSAHCANQFVFRWYELYAVQKNITAIWNTLVLLASADGFLSDYFIPANDDLRFETDPYQAVPTLSRRYNLGTIAFHDRWMPGFPTFFLCHVRHLSVFPVLYPVPWQGAHQDPWIHDVYFPWGGPFDSKVIVHNRMGISNARYDYGTPTGYFEAVKAGRRRVNEHLRQTSFGSGGVIAPIDDAKLEACPTRHHH